MSSRKFAQWGLVIILLLLCGTAFGQTTTGSLLGTVTDPANAVIQGADIQLIDQTTGAARSATTDTGGLFRFPNLNPSTYRVVVKANGFKTFTQKDITLSANETRDIGRVPLEIGSVTEEVAVTAQATPVQVASSEKAGLVDGKQLNSLALKGRDAFSFMALLPGVVDTSNRDMISTSGDGSISVNGNQTSMSNMVDGITDRDAGAASGVHFVPNMDAIAEVKLLASNYQAEYGRNAGGVVTMVTKSGGQEFHGSAWWVHRHEGFNANGYFNNQAGKKIPPYRYNVPGWSFGGPVYIPGKFNKDKSKFFFFASQEFVRLFVPVSLQKQTMPTVSERAGDFSQSFDAKGNLIKITDPLNNGAAFPNNTIPTTRINTLGQNILNFLPTPNWSPAQGTSDYGNYNFQDNGSAPRPISDTVVRGDVYATSKLNGYFRLVRNSDNSEALYQGVQWSKSTTSANTPLAQYHTNPGRGESGSVSYVFSPTTLNQFTFGHSMNNWTYVIDDAKLFDRSLMGNMPWLFPTKTLSSMEGVTNIDGMHNFIPSATFAGGSRPNPGQIQLGGYAGAYFNWNDAYIIQDNFSKTMGPHSFKAGIYLERNLKTQPVNNNWMGAYSFNVDANNPLNAGDGFANALLGNYTSYNEANTRPLIQGAFWNMDFYVQDSWRVTRRLTLELGVRFVHQESQYDRGTAFSVFNPAQYSANKMAVMYIPYCTTGTAATCAGANRFAQDPKTGALAPATAIGQFVPGSGDYANGMQVLGQNGVSKYAYNMKSLVPGPRLGFAWDVFGNGKMAIRGGFGVMYDRLEGNQVYNMAGVPPQTYTPTVYYGNINSLGGGSAGVVGPASLNNALYGEVPFTRVQNASLSVQRALPGSMVLEVGWVGNWGYHLNMSNTNINGAPGAGGTGQAQGGGSGQGGININPVALGARFNNIDPTTGKALNDNLLRTIYPGYANIIRDNLNGSSNYEGLQTSLNRRFSKGLMFGMSYTFSKSLGLTSYQNLVPDNTKYFYGPTANYRKHIFAFNYSYDIPNLGQKLNNKILGIVTDHYTLSGITSAQSGPPLTPTCSSSSGADITGSPNGTYRCLMVGDPKQNVPAGAIFNPAAFALPTQGTIGNMGAYSIMGTGFNNWDAVITKVIPVGPGERRVFKLALQAYNVFNQSEFNAWNTVMSFSASGDPSKLVTSAVGQPSVTRSARILATSLRFEF